MSNVNEPRGCPATSWSSMMSPASAIATRRLVRGARGQHNGRRRPRHIAGGSDDPAVPHVGVGDRDRQRPGIGHRDTGGRREPGCEQIGLGDRHRGRVFGQARQHDRRLGRTRLLGSWSAGSARSPPGCATAPRRMRRASPGCRLSPRTTAGPGRRPVAPARSSRSRLFAQALIAVLGSSRKRSSHTHPASDHSPQHLIRPAAQREQRRMQLGSGQRCAQPPCLR